MDAYFIPLDFSAINGYPHSLPKKAIENLPSFQGNNAVSAKSHLKAFSLCINKWYIGATHNHQDVKMKLFSLSLEENAFDWFSGLDDNKFTTIKDLIEAFTERWGDKKEHSHLLAALHSIKKNEKETMEEFNNKFNDLISSLHKDIKPPDTSILIYYIEAFNGEMRYQLRDKESTTLKVA
jgi:replication-associated recombination protein RarA